MRDRLFINDYNDLLTIVAKCLKQQLVLGLGIINYACNYHSYLHLQVSVKHFASQSLYLELGFS